MTYKTAAVTANRRTIFAQTLPRAQAAAERFKRGGEPGLQELLDDPIMHRLLASDGVTRDHLLALIDDVKARLEAA